jgi:hypothetical protein
VDLNKIYANFLKFEIKLITPFFIRHKCESGNEGRHNFELLFSVSVYVHRIELRDFELKNFLAPFSKGLWITAVIVMFTMSFCLTVIHNFELHEESGRRYGFFRSLLHIFSIFCQQGRTGNLYFLLSPVNIKMYAYRVRR